MSLLFIAIGSLHLGIINYILGAQINTYCVFFTECVLSTPLPLQFLLKRNDRETGYLFGIIMTFYGEVVQVL